MKRTSKRLAATAITGLSLAALPNLAFANNTATVSGATPVVDQTVAGGCNTTWDAESVYSTDASKYPAGLLTTRDGQPVSGGAAGGNGGYVKEVSTDLDPNAPGKLEINRFSAGATDLQARFIVGSLNNFAGNLTYTVTLPTLPSGAKWTLTDGNDTARPTAAWGSSYAPYFWTLPEFRLENQFPAAGTSGGTYTFTLPPLNAKIGEVFQFSANDATAEDDASLTDYKITVSGTYADCTLATPTTATVTTPATPPTTKTVHVAEVPAVTKVVTTPAKPAVYGLQPGHDRELVQEDTYFNAYAPGTYLGTSKYPLGKSLALTPAQVKARDAARAHDKAQGKLEYRKGSASPWLWGSTKSVFKELDLCTASKPASNTDRWVVHTEAGASIARPWGASGKVAQTSPTTGKCGATKVLVTPAVPAKTTTVVVTPAVPAHDVTVVTPGTPASTHTLTTWQCTFPKTGAATKTVTEGTGCLDSPSRAGSQG